MIQEEDHIIGDIIDQNQEEIEVFQETWDQYQDLGEREMNQQEVGKEVNQENLGKILRVVQHVDLKTVAKWKKCKRNECTTV